MDCLEGIKQIDDNSIHLIITSPPYNIGKDYGEYKDDLNYKDYILWLDSIWKLHHKILINGGYMCINIGSCIVSENKRTHAKQTSIREILPSYAHVIVSCLNIGFSFQEHIIWDKIGNTEDNKMVFGSYPFPVSVYSRKVLEHILIFKKGTYRNIDGKRIDENKISLKEWKEFTNPIWNFNGERMYEHCAPFPIELSIRLTKMFSFTNDIVLDPFMGSGTTAVAAKQLNRNFIGFEINEEYVKIANKRLKQQVLNEYINNEGYEEQNIL